MSEHNFDKIQKELKKSFDEQRAQGNYHLVRSGSEQNGNPTYKKVVSPSDNSNYWNAQLSAYYFNSGR